MSSPLFGAKEDGNTGCSVAGSENIGTFMGNEEVKITCSKSKLHFHSNKKCELDLMSSARLTMLACEGLEIKNHFGIFDIRDSVNCTIVGEGVSAVIEESEDIHITNTFNSIAYAIKCKQVEIDCEDSQVVVINSSQVSAKGEFMTCLLQDIQDSSFVANDDGVIMASKARRINAEASDRRYVTITGVEDFNITPATDDRSYMHIVPSPEDSNERPLRVDVKYSRIAQITPVEYTLGVFKFWKQKENGEAAKKDNIFGIHFQTERFEINGFKVIEESNTKVTFQGKMGDRVEFLEIEGNIKGLSADRRILYISTNVTK